jgi:ribose/xylose/arabinose/galactoside ABC-type transport system permease subunit
MGGIGRSLVILGLVVVGLGLALIFSDRLPFKIGQLPGDIVWKGKNTTFYFPLVTSILISVVLSLVLWFFGRR